MDPAANCPRCHQPPPAAARFCPRCGTALTGGVVRSATPVTALLLAWRKLSRALTRNDARRLLGEPLRIEVPETAGAASLELWRYEYHAEGDGGARVQGVVRFSAAEGRVESWVEPDWTAIGGAGSVPGQT